MIDSTGDSGDHDLWIWIFIDGNAASINSESTGNIISKNGTITYGSRTTVDPTFSFSNDDNRIEASKNSVKFSL